MKDVLAAMQTYFESMVVYRISSLISTLTNFQVKLLSKSKTLSPGQMDSALNLLEDIKKLLNKTTEKY